MPDLVQHGRHVAVVIPARWGSTRFPGKPMAMIAGRTMIERVWRLAQAAGPDQVLVAVDDPRLADHCAHFGAQVVMTDPACRNGTERALQAIERLAGPVPDAVVNLQGDAVLTPPWILAAVTDVMRADPAIPIATPAVRLDAAQLAALRASKAGGDAGGTTVTFTADGWALYFSKAIIPFLRGDFPQPPVWRHVGLYGFRLDVLRRYVTLPPGRFEQAEQLEQLRALEAGIPIRVVETDYRGRTHWSVDAPADIGQVEAIIAAEGELLP